jgi:hypothetical protein
MAEAGFWETVSDAFTGCIKNLLTPEKSEVEVKAAQKAAEIKALQAAENAAKAFEAAPAEKWQAVDTATARYKS